jgi:uncharacterized protein with PIN domain
MKYAIEGADRYSGRDIKCSIEAESEKQALLSAKKRGILVSKIEQLLSEIDLSTLEQFAEEARQAPVISKPPAVQSNTCQNCNRTIGKLEEPHQWDDHVVCAQCSTLLARQAPSKKTKEGEEFVICPNANCGYHGKAVKQACGSRAVAYTLMILGGLPGLIYILVTTGWEIKCPKCQQRIRRIYS